MNLRNNGKGRQFYNFNPGWRFLRGACLGAESTDFDDEAWEGAELPHGLEVLPENGSGGINYQGQAWYRKRFQLPESLTGRKVFLRFEAIMGQSKVWVNGHLVKEHFGGYLPIHLDIGEHLVDGDNVVAVWCDNRNCPDYPPGKEQEMLDFSYFGGIYRDTDLIICPKSYLNDANDPRFDLGGVQFRTLKADGKKATFACRVGWASDEKIDEAHLELRLVSPSKEEVFLERKMVSCAQDQEGFLEFEGVVDEPELWTPETPHLYQVECRLICSSRSEDHTSFKTGLRTIKLDGVKGLSLNGQPYKNKLFGVNRHQDYPHLGNALGALLHERDAIKFHKAGLNLVRSAHYPQDRSFMDACDRLGIMVIVATPGWQFFNPAEVFLERVYDDLRQMVRRDRNRPSVFLWEPILNETRYTEDFATKAFATVREEDPDRPYAADRGTPGSEHCELIYAHHLADDDERPCLAREWGDSPDDWINQSGRARMAYHQGENAQMVQVHRYMESISSDSCLTLPKIQKRPPQYLGAALWAGIECQRGYHPDPFYGGLLGLHRQEKYSYFLFQSQRGPDQLVPPMVHIANEMTPSSPEDVMVFTNCEEVVLKLDDVVVDRRRSGNSLNDLLHPPICFPNAFTWTRTLDREHNLPKLTAIGLIDGEEVCEHIVRRPGRKMGLKICADLMGIPARAGGEVLPFFVEVVDEKGRVIPYANEWIDVEVSGAGSLIGEGADVFLNPIQLKLGSAPILIKTGPMAGQFTINVKPKFEGAHTPKKASISIDTQPNDLPFCFDPSYAKEAARATSAVATELESHTPDWREGLKEVGRDQQDFAG